MPSSREAAATGIDIFRIFDAPQRRRADATGDRRGARDRRRGRRGGDQLHRRPDGPSTRRSTTSTTTCGSPTGSSAAGAHVLAIKDMAGLLRAPAAARWSARCGSGFDLPMHMHTHDTPGGQLATYLAAMAAGADAVDGASVPLAGTTSQPPLSAIVATPPPHTERDTGPRPAGGVRAGTVLGGGAAGVRAVRVGPDQRPTGRVYHARDPRRAAVEPSAAGARARPRRPVRGHRDQLRRRRPRAGPSGQGDPELKVVGDLALALVGAQMPVDGVRRGSVRSWTSRTP